MKTRVSFVDPPLQPQASFWTSLQFETLAWCSKLAFASHKHSFINLSPSHIPPLHLSPSITSHFLVSFHFTLLPIASCSVPRFPFCHFPLLSVPLLQNSPPTLMNTSASFFPWIYVRPTSGSWGERVFFFSILRSL